MKKGHKRLLFFEILLFIILFLNSFVYDFLSGINISIFLVIVLIIFKYLFGFEKDKHRFIKDVILEIIIFLFVFFLLYYLSGLIISFARTGDYLNIKGLQMFIFPIVCYILLREYLRYMFMCKSEGNNILIISTVILFIFLDITTAIYYANFESNYKAFVFIASIILPAVSSNIIFSYITTKVGYKPIIVYALIINLYQYLLPIVPNPSQYLVTMIDILLPILLGYKINKFFRKADDEEIKRDYNKKKKKLKSLVPIAIAVIILIYFTSGYFRFWAIAIASGSMEPKIHKGDIVIINRDYNIKSIKKGEVMAYRHSGIIVVHRIIKKEKNKGKYYFVTKGDANKKEDNIVIDESMIVGIVDYKVPYIGLPTVWLNNK